MVRVTFEKGRRQKGFKTTFGKRFKIVIMRIFLQNKYLEMKANSHPLSIAYSLFQGALELSTGEEGVHPGQFAGPTNNHSH